MNFAILRMGLQLTVALYMMLRKYKHRKLFGAKMAIGAFSVVLIALMQDGLLKTAIRIPTFANFYLIIVICIVWFWTAYKVSIQEYIFAFIASTIAQDGAFNLYLLCCSVLAISTDEIPSYEVYFIVFSITYIALDYFFISRFRKQGKAIIKLNAMLISFFVYLINQVTSLFIIFDQNYSWSNAELRMYTVIFSIMALFLQFGIVQMNNLESENQQIEAILEAERKQHALSKENIDLINFKCHDLKQQIAAIRQITTENSQEEELRKIEESIMFYNSIVTTDCEALDMILTEKKLVCEKNRIRLSCMVDGKNLSFMKDVDIYTLFGNAIDNAIESVRDNEDEGKRYISMNVVRKGSMISIHLENYCNKKLTYEEEIPISTKGDKRFHGFGLKSMRFIVEKYDGILSVTEKNEQFLLNIMIPIPE